MRALSVCANWDHLAAGGLISPGRVRKVGCAQRAGPRDSCKGTPPRPFRYVLEYRAAAGYVSCTRQARC